MASPVAASFSARAGRTRKVTSRPASRSRPPKYPPVAPAPTTRKRMGTSFRARATGRPDQTGPSARGRRVEVHGRVHGVEPEPRAGVHQDPARLVLGHREERVARVLLPVEQVV